MLLMVLGAVVGMHHHRRARGAVWGIVTGGILGSVLGPLSLAPIRALPAIYSVSVTGCLVVVALGVALRYGRGDV